MGELDVSFSLYSIAGNNPVLFNDSLGLWKDSIQLSYGSWAYTNKEYEENVYVRSKGKWKNNYGAAWLLSQNNNVNNPAAEIRDKI